MFHVGKVVNAWFAENSFPAQQMLVGMSRRFMIEATRNSTVRYVGKSSHNFDISSSIWVILISQNWNHSQLLTCSHFNFLKMCKEFQIKLEIGNKTKKIVKRPKSYFSSVSCFIRRLRCRMIPKMVSINDVKHGI